MGEAEFFQKSVLTHFGLIALSLSLSQLVHYEEHFVNGGSYSLSRSEYEIDNNVGRTSRPRLCLQKVFFFFFLLTKFSLTFFFSLLYINV